MTCSEFMDMLDNYELLTDSQREELKIHTSECEACRKEFEFFQSIISITSQIPVPKAPKSLIDDVNAELDKKRTPFILLKSNLRVLSTVAACLAVGLAVGLNNGYIKKSINNNENDGIITETTLTATEQPTDTPVDVPVAEIEDIGEKTELTVVTGNAKPHDAVKSTQIPTQTPVSSATEKPDKTQTLSTPKPDKTQTPSTPKPTPEKAQTQDVPTQMPVVTAEPVPDVNAYEIADKPKEEYAYNRRNSLNKTKSTFTDYLYVESEDMGAVVSTMSEMGFKVSGGYYMGSRADFYALMDRLSEQGIGYECSLKYNSGDDIAFSLQYS